MKIIYNKEIDIQCWEKVINANDTFGVWFNTKFPTKYEITPEMELKAVKSAELFNSKWKRDNDLEKGMTKIFGECPEIICYINTSPYSMDIPEGISISMERPDPIRTIFHEANHFIARKKFGDIPNFEKIKEIITVVNDDVFGVNDGGWKIFKLQREKARQVWDKTHDINKVIESIDSL